MPRGVHLTEAQTAEIVSAYESGLSQAEVARQFGCSAAAVCVLLKRRGVKKRRATFNRKPQADRDEFVRRYRTGENVRQIARAMGCNPKTVSAALHGAGIQPRMGGPRTYSDAERGRWVEDYVAGSSVPKVAAKHGASDWSVFKAVRDAGALREHGPSLLTYPAELVERVEEMYVGGESQLGVAEALGISQPTVSKILRLRGVTIRRNMRGAAHPSWKGGRTIDGRGYVCVRSDEFPEMVRVGGYVMEHRLVMARHLRRALLPRETVHHKNGDRADNRIENLELRVGPHGSGASASHCPTCSCFAA